MKQLRFQIGDIVKDSSTGYYGKITDYKNDIFHVEYSVLCEFFYDGDGNRLASNSNPYQSRMQLVCRDQQQSDTIPTLLKGKMMEVSNDMIHWVERNVLGQLQTSKGIRCIAQGVTSDTILVSWKYCREIQPKPQITTLTMDDIAKKFNIPVEQLNIQK
jgi:hypothetical protein